MAKIIIQSIGFASTPNAPQVVDIKYKLGSDPDVPGSYTAVSTNLTVPVTGEINPDIEITGLSLNTSYTVAITNKCSNRTTYKLISIDAPITYVWLENTFICEDDEVISAVSTYSNFSSPSRLYYHPTKQRMYVVDLDNVNGNIGYFNPNTFSGVSDLTVLNDIQQVIYDGSIAIDPVREKIYVAGQNTGGLMVFDMVNDVLEAVIPYGANVAFGRILVTLQNNVIYCSYTVSGTNTLTLINPDTLSVISTITVGSVPSGGTNLVGGYNITAVEGNLWATYTSGRSAGGIAIYNSTFTTLVATITLTGSAVVPGWGFGKYWGNSFYDEAKDRFYMHDTGSSKLFVINTLTNTVVHTISFNNREGKAYVNISMKLDPNTNKLFVNYTAFNDLSDPTTIDRLYLLNRDTYALETMTADFILGDAEFQTGSSFVWGVDPGLPVWVGGLWATDGKINKLSY